MPALVAMACTSRLPRVETPWAGLAEPAAAERVLRHDANAHKATKSATSYLLHNASAGRAEYRHPPALACRRAISESGNHHVRQLSCSWMDAKCEAKRQVCRGPRAVASSVLESSGQYPGQCTPCDCRYAVHDALTCTSFAGYGICHGDGVPRPLVRERRGREPLCHARSEPFRGTLWPARQHPNNTPTTRSAAPQQQHPNNFQIRQRDLAKRIVRRQPVSAQQGARPITRLIGPIVAESLPEA